MRELGLQKVMKIRLFDITTKEMLAMLNKLNESTFTNGQETTFLTNGNGVNVASFDHSKSASISGANSRISGDLMAIQVGSDVEELTSTTLIQKNETLTIATNSAITSDTATGTVDAEIGFVYVLDSNGNKVKTLTQTPTTATATTFVYDSGTKTITTMGLADGTKINLNYYPTTTSASRIKNITTNVSKTCKVVADVMFKDICTDALVAGQIVAEKGKVSGAFEWNVSEGGSPALHNFQVDFLENCGDDNLWTWYVIN